MPGQGQADIAKAFQLHLEPVECFWIIGNDLAGNVHTIVEVARGSHWTVNVDIAASMTAVLATGASAFSVVHNHPTRDVTPSAEDRDLTNAIMEAANTVGLLFEDHVIVEPGGKSFSFRQAGLINGVTRPQNKAATRRKR